jgi:Cdc6-like AAA superfamily ATPase
MPFLIPKQTEAETDLYLLECFHDANFISELTENNFSIVSGRKGTGKTALARFLQEKYRDYNINFSYRISIGEPERLIPQEDLTTEIIFFVLTRATQLLLKNNLFRPEGAKFWNEYLLQNGLSTVENYEAFATWKKNSGAQVSIPNYVLIGQSKELKRVPISNSLSNLFPALIESVLPEKSILFFIDDLSDHLDRSDGELLGQHVSAIENTLLRLDRLNTSLFEQKNGFVLLLAFERICSNSCRAQMLTSFIIIRSNSNGTREALQVL